MNRPVVIIICVSLAWFVVGFFGYKLPTMLVLCLAVVQAIIALQFRTEDKDD
jgi:uncharacterized membrane protein